MLLYKQWDPSHSPYELPEVMISRLYFGYLRETKQFFILNATHQTIPDNREVATLIKMYFIIHNMKLQNNWTEKAQHSE